MALALCGLFSCNSEQPTQSVSLDSQDGLAVQGKPGVSSAGLYSSPPSSEAQSSSALSSSSSSLPAGCQALLYPDKQGKDTTWLSSGMVCLSADAESLSVTYSPEPGLTWWESHLWLDTSQASLPWDGNSGNLALSAFPYQSPRQVYSLSYTHRIPLESFGYQSTCAPETLWVVAEATLHRNGEGTERDAYGDGARIGRVGRIFPFVVPCLPPPPLPLTCESAFAYGEDWALPLNGIAALPSNRWGWVNGPLAQGEYSFPLYAGAGRNDLEKGVNTGEVEIEVGEDSAVVRFRMERGFFLAETHLYLGLDTLPRHRNGSYTAAPGQYGNTHSLDTLGEDSFRLALPEGSPFLVAHAVVCSRSW